jgi:serine/threonine protein kinase
LIHPFAGQTTEDVLNEARAINILYAKSRPENLVAVIAHGWIPEIPIYFIDMELCEGNLDDFIQSPQSFSLFLSGNPRLLNINFVTYQPCHTWDIMEQIAAGVAFIHKCNEVHRDLKPQNGRTPIPE